MNLLYKNSNTDFDNGIRMKHNIKMEEGKLQYCALKIIEMDSGKNYLVNNMGVESCVVALKGRMTIKINDKEYVSLGNREDIFYKTPPDAMYITCGQPFEIHSETNLTVAICSAIATKEFPNRILKGNEIKIENRGKYSNKRRVHNILDDQKDYAQHLLVVEVYTAGGNWSSYPPHKHDENNYPYETYLEEIYYHEQNPDNGFVFQRVYTEDRSIDQTMTVENGDAVIVPKGYHPVAVPDGYESYYLNVMAGPVRKWKFHNDKDHEWILERE